jgi:hypothetical protein
MFGQEGGILTGSVDVAATKNKGLSVEFWADRCLDKIVYVSGNSNPYIKEQAEAFKEEIREVLIAHMKNAIVSDRTTLYNLFTQQGEVKMAEILRRI